MPMINVKVIEGVFTSAQKQEMIRKLTDTMVSIEGENMRPATIVIVEEVRSGDWGFAGRPMTTKAALALAAGRPIRQRVARRRMEGTGFPSFAPA